MDDFSLAERRRIAKWPGRQAKKSEGPTFYRPPLVSGCHRVLAGALPGDTHKTTRTIHGHHLLYPWDVSCISLDGVYHCSHRVSREAREFHDKYDPAIFRAFDVDMPLRLHYDERAELSPMKRFREEQPMVNDDTYHRAVCRRQPEIPRIARARPQGAARWYRARCSQYQTLPADDEPRRGRV